MKNTRSFTTSAVLLAGCLLLAFPALAKTTLKLSHNQDKSHAVHKAMSYLADKAKAYSDGELNIRIYPNATLGNERESLELMNSGALQMVKVNAASLESFAPEYSVFSLPFLFRDRDHYYNVLKSDLGKRILASSESKGFVGLTWYDGGARSFYAGKPITQPDDLAGMKIRVQQSPSAIAMVKALGGVPTPMAQGELYTALQQGVVDGGENNPVVYADMRHAEVAKFYSHDEHTMVPDVLVISTKVLNKLSDKERKALYKAADESMQQMKDVIWPAAEKEAYASMKAMNATVVDIDKSAFKQSVKPLFDEFRAKDAQSAKDLEYIENM
ncbi:TRAP transporter substrate-binding protein [Salmonella enterica]|uniref:C4-dicarboxylate ABC transporter substrate-binding protein n=1 Tax=Salmonella enterica subsp. enterica serovar Macclesfield str. S-1643 TaxID=1242107 RepID=A0A2C9NVA4_SALET|nr:TRAP transporter substrate-binding protein [Salmonella enterica]ASG15143.1 C4-dicarboxylate ABC transporter substrate-binding protein [Salmonella enterica subsp. enterica serovar Macclesfield str. S-1643]EAA5484528.1 TRAP transporter substrate-binding protein [Salmonella enterica subsp. enterica serovar Kouka]EBG2393072.1 TRAP transporter substrate-binding protein [Salmonella enterica subsp. enterica serovar Everleigh]ECD5048489.1 TRAP transporter substrate-binding protein [Salmonella enteri